MIASIAEIVVPLLGALLLGFVCYLVRASAKYVEKRFSLDVEDRILQRADSLVERGILYAEEWALKKLKSGEDKPSGEDKLVQAVEFVRKEAEQCGLEDWVVLRGESLGRLVESKITKVL